MKITIDENHKDNDKAMIQLIAYDKELSTADIMNIVAGITHSNKSEIIEKKVEEVHQWFRNGIAIEEAINKVYTTTYEDTNKSITYKRATKFTYTIKVCQ